MVSHNPPNLAICFVILALYFRRAVVYSHTSKIKRISDLHCACFGFDGADVQMGLGSRVLKHRRGHVAGTRISKPLQFSLYATVLTSGGVDAAVYIGKFLFYTYYNSLSI